MKNHRAIFSFLGSSLKQVKKFVLLFTILPILLTTGCLNATSEATFIGGRDVDLCEGVWNVCKGHTAGCILDEDHYIEGAFPGMRKFLVETTRGDWKIKVMLFLKDRLAPGNETEIRWYEPGCTDEYEYKLSKNKMAGDLFEQAGPSQMFEEEHAVIEPGDHLVSVWSDATCRYDLKIEINRQ